MKKLIELHSQDLVICDNPKCEYKIESKTGDPNEDISLYINTPCPKCGENLLTEHDYRLHLKVISWVNWLNKWFSWLTFFARSNAEEKIITVHCHDKINIVKE